METKKKITENLVVGSQPRPDELEQMARSIRSVVNLREQDEDAPMSPDEEGDLVRRLGLEYLHLPVSSDTMTAQTVDEFRRRLHDLPKPVLLHCATGKRSGAFAMMHRAVREGTPGEDAVRQAEEMGFECDTPALEQFVQTYIDERLGQT